MRSNYPLINVYNKKNTKSKLVTQLLYGESFKIKKKSGKWIKIKNDLDGYIGYVKNKKFSQNCVNTHKVSTLYTNIYSKPDTKSKTVKKLSFNSKIKVINKTSNFYKFDNQWVKKKDLKKINFINKDIFKNINKFINIKYKWGGKHYTGIDCSGLVQLFLNFNNKFCPRDTKDQIKYFKKNIFLNKIKKNDLIFWKGHVAVAISNKKLIHGYGPFKKVVMMPIKSTINRIYKTANLKLTRIKRIT